MPALLLGSISTLADTSELQRAAFNQVFAEQGLGWSWSREEYRDLLTGNGGEQRIADQARATGTEVDAAALHARKSAIFQESLSDKGTFARPGVEDTVRLAKEQGLALALVTTTSPENVAALFVGLRGAVRAADFDLVVDASHVTAGKPDSAAYVHALAALGERAEDCVAVEDNTGGVQAAAAAGITCVAFPNENTTGHDFTRAHHVVDHLDLGELRALI